MTRRVAVLSLSNSKYWKLVAAMHLQGRDEGAYADENLKSEAWFRTVFKLVSGFCSAQLPFI